MISDSSNLQRILDALNRDHQQEKTMGQRIRADDIRTVLTDSGHEPGLEGDWEPGHVTIQHGPRIVHVHHYGPGGEQQLAIYTTVLREAGFHVVTEQQKRADGSRRLVVTKP